MKVHDFDESLRRSHGAADLSIWEEIYRQAFPTFASMTDHRKNGYWQTLGIDRSVTLEDGQQILVDEKVRYRNYGDIALEYVSNDQRKAPGWVCKELRCHYIAYAIAPLGKCYLMPVIQLQAAWKRHGDDWLANKDYRNIEALNYGYATLSCCVPAKVVFRAIHEGFLATFEPFEKASQPTLGPGRAPLQPDMFDRESMPTKGAA